MTNFNWSIISMSASPQVNEQENVVLEVDWECKARDEQYTAIADGSVSLTYDENTSFTPYNQLTQDQVWGWINSSIDRSEIESSLQAMIDEQKQPAIVTPPLPWEIIQQNT